MATRKEALDLANCAAATTNASAFDGREVSPDEQRRLRNRFGGSGRRSDGHYSATASSGRRYFGSQHTPPKSASIIRTANEEAITVTQNHRAKDQITLLVKRYGTSAPTWMAFFGSLIILYAFYAGLLNLRSSDPYGYRRPVELPPVKSDEIRRV